MIDLYYAPTPNAGKISIMLEELGVSYTVVPSTSGPATNSSRTFWRSSPNNRIPAIVDRSPFGWPASRFGIRDRRHPDLSRQKDRPLSACGYCVQVQGGAMGMWQMSRLGPMLGQHGHFRALPAQEKIPYAIERYRDEDGPAYRVLRYAGWQDRCLRRREYSIADTSPAFLTMTHKAQGLYGSTSYPNVSAGMRRSLRGPQVQAGLGVGNS